MSARFDDEDIVAGFILNKLYLGRYFGKRRNIKHGRHTEVTNMQKGYPPQHRGLFKKVIKFLENIGLVITFPSTGEDHICAILDDEVIERGLPICNKYRLAVGLTSKQAIPRNLTIYQKA